MIAAALIAASLSATTAEAVAAGVALNESLRVAVECVVEHVPYPSWDVPGDVIKGIDFCKVEVGRSLIIREQVLGGGLEQANWYIENTIGPMVIKRVLDRQRMR